MFPGIYGYQNEQYFLAIISVSSSLCSINFWRDATYSYRRTVDVIMAKLTFVIYVITGMTYVTCLPFLITGYSALFALLYCYYMSNKHGDSNLWWKYHMMFHLLVSCTQIIAIKSIVDYDKLCLE
jgi:hypothetical protein